jgi:hypothetical protein
MKKKLINISKVVFVSLVVACAAPKKPIKPIVDNTPKIVMPTIDTSRGNLVPFTRDLFFKLRESGLDVRRLKFFVDKVVTLTKLAGANNMTINPYGVLETIKGNGDQSIQITPQTSGVVESVEGDGVWINFGRANSAIKFINNAASPKYFSLSGDKFEKDKGTVEVSYNNSVYKASSFSNVTEVKLLIKQLDIDIMNNKPIEEIGAKPGY